MEHNRHTSISGCKVPSSIVSKGWSLWPVSQDSEKSMPIDSNCSLHSGGPPSSNGYSKASAKERSSSSICRPVKGCATSNGTESSAGDLGREPSRMIPSEVEGKSGTTPSRSGSGMGPEGPTPSRATLVVGPA
eukprot:2583422-Pleurochrysis_carterae.AAC.1